MIEGLDYKAYPILFVDDEKLAGEVFKAQFSDQLTILTASSGMEALEVLEHNEIAVLISDQRMPEMSGNALLVRVRESRPDTVRMIITAYADVEAAIDSINSGEVYRYVSKPYDEVELRNILQQGIERYYLVRERDRLYAEKIETFKKIARTNRLTAIGVLAAGMAHEINNPLVAISTFLQMLPEKLREPKKDNQYWDDFYQVSLNETERIRGLIGQLLNYSKTAERESLELRDSDLNPLVRDAVTFLGSEARKKGVDLELKLQSGLPHGKLDREKMRQVILNLLLNAIQATPSGKITLATGVLLDEMRRDYLELTVSDTGVGISEENLQKLFNPFFTTKETQGSGLGLMTCYHIIEEQHRGSIDVRSELGRGTSVTVRIPTDPAKHERRKTDRRRLSDV
jgi:signal transduction histidine kinase